MTEKQAETLIRESREAGERDRIEREVRADEAARGSAYYPWPRNPIDSDQEYGREHAAAMAADDPESSANVGDADDDRLTVAIRVCAHCRRFLGVAEWRGSDAHDGEPWCETAGICTYCYSKMEGEVA